MRVGANVIFLATRPPRASPLPRGSAPEDAAAARREACALESREARREGGVGTHAVARALQACLPVAGDAPVRALSTSASSRYAPSPGEPGAPPGKWTDALRVMSDALRDLESARTPHLGSSRPLDVRNDSVRIVHPLSHHGSRKAVFVVINYERGRGDARASRGQSAPSRHASPQLRKRDEDCRWMVEKLAARGFDDPDGIRILVDDGHDAGQPTKANILKALRWLTKNAENGDSLAFYFSGRTKETTPEVGATRLGRTDASDDAFSAMLPCDFADSGAITREELYESLIEPLPRGVYLTVVFDCPDANAAEAVDAPYAWTFPTEDAGEDSSRREGALKRPPESARAVSRAAHAVADALATRRDADRGKRGDVRDERAKRPKDALGKRNGDDPSLGCCAVS